MADSRNLISKANGHPFTTIEMRKLIQIKEQNPNRFGEEVRTGVRGRAVYEFESVQQEAELIAQMTTEPRKNWVIIDATATDADAGRTLARTVLGCACYCTANKNPWADYDSCVKLYREAERTHTLLGLNCIAGVWVDQMEILPVVMQQLKSGRLVVTKRDNSSLNLFFEKVGCGIPAEKAMVAIAASGHLEPDLGGLASEVRDQRLKAKIAANIMGLLSGFKIDFTDNTLSRNSLANPRSLDPKAIADWHRAGRRKKFYPALITEISVDTEARRISCMIRFSGLPRSHPLAGDLGGKSAISVQAFDSTKFIWPHKSNQKGGGRVVHAGFGGGEKTAEKLLWEAKRAVELGKYCCMSRFSPIPILWALACKEVWAKRLEKKLANSLVGFC